MQGGPAFGVAVRPRAHSASRQAAQDPPAASGARSAPPKAKPACAALRDHQKKTAPRARTNEVKSSRSVRMSMTRSRPACRRRRSAAHSWSSRTTSSSAPQTAWVSATPSSHRWLRTRPLEVQFVEHRRSGTHFSDPLVPPCVLGHFAATG